MRSNGLYFSNREPCVNILHRDTRRGSVKVEKSLKAS